MKYHALHFLWKAEGSRGGHHKDQVKANQTTYAYELDFRLATELYMIRTNTYIHTVAIKIWAVLSGYSTVTPV